MIEKTSTWVVRFSFMKIIISLYLVFQFANFCNAQKDSADQIWTGSANAEKLYKNFMWFSEGYEEYIPDSTYINQLKEKLSVCRLLIFAGTWCGDTHTLIPALYKVTDLAGLSRTKIELYLLNEHKKSPRRLERKYKIKAIPVIIIFREEKELGRIIENAEVSPEADLLKVLK